MSIAAMGGAALGASALSSGSSTLNAQNSNSSMQAGGFADSTWGSTQASEAMSRLYGSAASAEDILRANEANAYQNAFLEKQMAYNSQEAARNREYQAYMSNTAYQRAVADLKAAGLNPILAAGNLGATTPSGSFASSGLQTAYKANTYADQESWSRGSGGSWGNSHSEEFSESMSKTTTQLASMLDGIGKVFNAAGSAMNATTDKKLTGNRGTTTHKINPNSPAGQRAMHGQNSLKSLTSVIRSIHK